MYTLHMPDGKRDLRLEHGLSGLEGSFVTLRSQRLESRANLEIDDRLNLLVFIAAMRARTPKQRDHWKKQWQGAVDMMNRMRERMMEMTPEQRKKIPPTVHGSGPSFDQSVAEQLAKNPTPALIYSAIESLFPAYVQMNLSILWTEEKPGFITSDNPCAWYDPEVNNRPFPYNSIGLDYKTVEVTMPLAPRYAALLTWKAGPLYTDVPLVAVNEINRRTRTRAQEHFVVNQSLVRDEWFNPGERAGGS
jgi:hypothetical protein